jgi:hypothetical protein
MTSDLRYGDWLGELRSAFGAGSDGVKIASPFIKQKALARLFEGMNPPSIRVITRFNLDHFYEGVSDLAALRELLALGAEVRGVRRLHAKLYLFGEDRAVITSANLTESGFERNHELGVVAKGDSLGIACCKYFDDMWEGAGSNLTATQLDEWQARIADAQVESPSSQMSGLGDEGTDLGGTEAQMPPWAEEPGKGFVKFFGKSDNRAERSFSIFTELERGGSHWACTYPKNKRPRAPRDGDVMFMGRLVHSPNDTLVFGRAIAIRYQEGRDDASTEDLAAREWKVDWPHYIRVHHGEFLSGTMENGVSLSALMHELGPYAFGPTLENLEAGVGNTNPRRAYGQAAAIRLSSHGLKWMNDELEAAFQTYGKQTPAQLMKLDWPDMQL